MTPSDLTPSDRTVAADLRAYYDEEARQRLRTPLYGRRGELRQSFIERLAVEGRHSVIDFGAGPGSDGPGFLDAGHRFVGIDLAEANCHLAAERGITVLHGSVITPPIRPHSFDAGWSMSTLMHLPEADVTAAVQAMAACLRPGAPMVISLWGGERENKIDRRIPGHQRLFCLRTLEHNHELLAAAATVEQAEQWPMSSDNEHYQVFHLRTD